MYSATGAREARAPQLIMTFRETKMPIREAVIALPLLLLYSSAPALAQDSLPVLNIEPACRAYSASQPDPQRGFTLCMEQEQNARTKLEKDWPQFASQDRQRCLGMTNELGGKTASYVEVLECVVIARDARAFEQKTPSDLNVSGGAR
jgi:hypothetical protein